VSQYTRSHLSDSSLLSGLTSHLSSERGALADVLADLAEVDTRKLYVRAAYSSMYAWCVGELHMSEDSACKRIRAARTAREFPTIFTAVAETRMHLSGVVLLAPHLTRENVTELLTATAHKSKLEIEQFLAQRFPQPDLPTRLHAVSPSSTASAPGLLADLPAESSAPGRINLTIPEPASAPARIEAPLPRPRVTPLAPERFALQTTIGQRATDNLRRAQELRGHRDIGRILDEALELYVRHLEKRRFAATDQPGRRRSSGKGRYVPAEVKRAVWGRDRGQCTFVSDTGRRCSERSRLEFDHVTEFARGGQATIGGIRLRCRAHNQYGAECTYGTEFMRHKREAHRATAGSPVRPSAFSAGTISHVTVAPCASARR